MDICSTAISDVKIIRPRVLSDERGFFMEVFSTEALRSAGISSDFVQENHSGSRQHVLRGLHYQMRRPQGKMVRVVSGQIFDVAVDLRRTSATFARWVGEVVSADNRKVLWIPPGFAHGFFVISSWAEVVYKTTEFYAPKYERTLLWNDETLRIGWPLPEGLSPVLSPKDALGVRLDKADIYD